MHGTLSKVQHVWYSTQTREQQVWHIVGIYSTRIVVCIHQPLDKIAITQSGIYTSASQALHPIHFPTGWNSKISSTTTTIRDMTNGVVGSVGLSSFLLLSFDVAYRYSIAVGEQGKEIPEKKPKSWEVGLMAVAKRVWVFQSGFVRLSVNLRVDLWLWPGWSGEELTAVDCVSADT